MKTYRLSYQTLATLMLSPVAVLKAADAPSTKPNIIFIMVDEMKWNAMSCAGNPIVKTPNLDKLAGESTRFSTAYTVAPISTPSRYSCFTSRYAHVHGSTDNDTPIRESQLFLPSILKNSGYQTAISGKLHYIYPNNIDYDFDYFWSFNDEGTGKLQRWPEYMTKKYGKGALRRLEIQPFPNDPLGKNLGKLGYPEQDSQTSWITARAFDFLNVRDQSKPFFLFVSYLDPHSPTQLCEPYWSMTQNEYNPSKIPLPKSFAQDPNKSTQSDKNKHHVNDSTIVKAMTSGYYAKMAMIDDNVGKLIAELQRRGLADNTLIVFTADHGNMLGDLNRWFKGVTYDGSTRIPLIIKAPATSSYAKQFNQGKVVSNIVENIDVMPTLCEMINVPLPQKGIQGKSMTALVAGKDANWKNIAYSERNSLMVRTAQYKLIKNTVEKDIKVNGEYELYDMTKDPLEMNNIIDNPSQTATVKNLKAMLEAWQKNIPAVPVIPGVIPLPLASSIVTPTTDNQPKMKEKEKKKKRNK